MLIHPSGCSEVQLCPFHQDLLNLLRLCPLKTWALQPKDRERWMGLAGSHLQGERQDQPAVDRDRLMKPAGLPCHYLVCQTC